MQVTRRERWIRTYRIVRVYKRGDRKREVVRSGLTLSEAREWLRSKNSCSRTAVSSGAQYSTRKYGEWIDYYESEVDDNGKIIRFQTRV